MKRKLVIVLIAVVSSSVLAIAAFAVVAHGKSHAAQVAASTNGEVQAASGLQPDTSSPNWKRLSEDVGVMVRRDNKLGLRGRLYVRVNGSWLPVAADGPGDTFGSIPVR